MGGWVIYNEVQSYRVEAQMKSSKSDVVAHVNELLTQLYQAEGLFQTQQYFNYGKQYSIYKAKMDSILTTVDSLASTVDNPVLKIDLESIKKLLLIKQANQKELLAMRMPNSIDSLYEHAIQKLDADADSLAINVQIMKNQQVFYDTTYQKHEKRSIGKGLRRLFKIGQTTFDSTLQITISKHMHVDSVVNKVDKNDSIANFLIEIIEDIKQKNWYANRERQNKEHKVMDNNLVITSQLRHLLANIEQDQIDEAYRQMQTQQQYLLRARRILVFFGALALLAIMIFVINILKDITKTQKYRKDLEEAKDKVEALLKNKELMMLSLSHDLKSPVNSIMGYAKLIEKENANQSSNSYVQSILQSSNHINNLVEDLLNLAKLEQGTFQLNKVPFVFNQLLQEIVDGFNRESTARQINLTLHTDISSSVYYHSDPVRLRQVFNNLVSNALKFTYKGSVAVKAELVHKETDYETIRISVKDTGIGISEEEQVNLFEPFNRGNIKDHQIKGTGLGLAITKRIVELLDGQISLESEPDKGTCISVSLPLPYAQTEMLGKGSANLIKGIEKKRVWLIDDDETFLKMMTTVLKAAKLNVKAFSCPRKALKAYKPNCFDLLVTDIQMPTMSGLELLKQINEQNKQTVRAIAITGMSEATELIAASDFTTGLLKPFLPEDLLHSIGQVLGVDVDVNQSATDEDYGSVKRLIAFADGDVTQEKEILKAFIQNEKINIKTLTKNINLVNVNGISELAHKMLNIYRQINTADIVELLVKLEAKNFEHLSRKEYFEAAQRTTILAQKLIDKVEKEQLQQREVTTEKV